MDYRLPGLDGIEATTAVLAAYPQAAVVCLTASASPAEIEALYDAGAVACVTKDQELDDIIAAVQGAVSPRLAAAE
jgi:DNA-binding NarL/FixJ family response regulator